MTRYRLVKEESPVGVIYYTETYRRTFAWLWSWEVVLPSISCSLEQAKENYLQLLEGKNLKVKTIICNQ